MLPLLALIPGLLYTGAKFVGPLIEQHIEQISPLLLKVLGNSPTGEKIVSAFESVLGNISDDKKQAMTIEMDSILGQIELDKIEATEGLFDRGWRPAIGWVCVLALGMSIFVEPTINYFIEFFGYSPPAAFVLSPLVMVLITGLCGIYMGCRTSEKLKGVN